MSRSLAFAALLALLLAQTCTLAALAAAQNPRSAERRWKDRGDDVLIDQKTRLEWSRLDNGREIDWHEAKRYCDGKHDGWRLPDLTELMAIYDSSVSGTVCLRALCHLSAYFDLTGEWFWSATPVGADGSDGSELTWGVLMVNGAKTGSVREASYGARALCVRNPS